MTYGRSFCRHKSAKLGIETMGVREWRPAPAGQDGRRETSSTNNEKASEMIRSWRAATTFAPYPDVQYRSWRSRGLDQRRSAHFGNWGFDLTAGT